MKKSKLKLKKQVWIFFIIIIFLAIGTYAGLKIYDDYKYKKTNEYKLLEKSYNKEEIKILEEKTNQEIINNLINSDKNEFLISLLKERYYLSKNFNTYLTFHKEHNDYNAQKVVTLVNTYNNYDHYDHDLETDLSKDYLLIVNKYYHLKEDYEPEDLVSVNNKYYYGENHKVRKIVYDAFIDMWNAANNDDIYLIINSSYRTFNSQKKVYDEYKNGGGTTYADTIAARPGYSEHQTGLSLDVFSKENTTAATFKNSTAHKWLINNAHKFGFIQRYPEGKEDITGFAEESWHWRYVGIPAATYIHENNITFDEYYAFFEEK